MKTIKLKADVEFGEGTIEVSDDFKSHNAVLKADLLKDWIYFLEQEYMNAVENELMGELDRRGVVANG